MENLVSLSPQFLDARRKYIVISDDAIRYAADHFIETATQAISKRGLFSVALSGGSTPKAIYHHLYKHHAHSIDWTKVHVFFSDERAVPPDDPESNFHMAMEAGFKHLRIPPSQIHRMAAEKDRSKHAAAYEALILALPGGVIDLMLLGMGNDGHTASLFPHTKALHEQFHLVVPNFIPEKQTWRMTVTYDCINHARNIVVYIFGAAKQEMVERAFYGPFTPDELPIQRVGSAENPALLMLDIEATPENLRKANQKGSR